MENLRDEVKLLKAFQDISYKEIAEYLEMPPKSFYNWLKGQYEFGEERENKLMEIINILKE